MNAISGGERNQPATRVTKNGSRQGLEPFVGWHAGPCVQKRGKVMADAFLMQDHIVVFVAIQFMKPQVWLCPMHAIFAFAIAGDLAFIAIEFGAPTIPGVQSEKVAILNHCAVFHVVGRFGHGGCQLRFMKLQVGTFHLFNQESINEQLPAITKVDRSWDFCRWKKIRSNKRKGQAWNNKSHHGCNPLIWLFSRRMFFVSAPCLMAWRSLPCRVSWN